MRHHVTDWQRFPAPQVPIGFGNRAENQRTIQSMQLAHNARQKRRDKISTLRRKALDRVKHYLFHASHLHFNIKEGLARVELKHVFKTRRFAVHRTLCMDLLQGARAHSNAVEFSVMANNGFFAAGAADVKFKTICVMVESKIE